MEFRAVLLINLPQAKKAEAAVDTTVAAANRIP